MAKIVYVALMTAIILVYSTEDVSAVPGRGHHGVYSSQRHNQRRPGRIPIYSHDYEIDFGSYEDPDHGHTGTRGNTVVHRHHIGDGPHNHGGGLQHGEEYDNRGNNRHTSFNEYGYNRGSHRHTGFNEYQYGGRRTGFNDYRYGVMSHGHK